MNATATRPPSHSFNDSSLLSKHTASNNESKTSPKQCILSNRSKYAVTDKSLVSIAFGGYIPVASV